jgi:hypothetical protein
VTWFSGPFGYDFPIKTHDFQWNCSEVVIIIIIRPVFHIPSWIKIGISTPMIFQDTQCCNQEVRHVAWRHGLPGSGSAIPARDLRYKWDDSGIFMGLFIGKSWYGMRSYCYWYYCNGVIMGLFNIIYIYIYVKGWWDDNGMMMGYVGYEMIMEYSNPKP